MKTKLKSILLFTSLLLAPAVSYAEDTVTANFPSTDNFKEVRKGYTGNAEAILGIMELGLNTTQGYRFNNHWSVGGCTGINVSWAGPLIPLMAVGQFDIPVHKNTALIVNAKAGWAFALTDDYDLKNRNGFTGDLGIGVRYKRMSYQLSYNAAFLKHYQHDTDEILDGYATIQFRIGFNFGAR